MSNSDEATGTDATGHALIGGARWHYPAPGRPTECAVPGCERVLGQRRRVSVDDYDYDANESTLTLSEDAGEVDADGGHAAA